MLNEALTSDHIRDFVREVGQHLTYWNLHRWPLGPHEGFARPHLQVASTPKMVAGLNPGCYLSGQRRNPRKARGKCQTFGKGFLHVVVNARVGSLEVLRSAPRKNDPNRYTELNRKLFRRVVFDRSSGSLQTVASDRGPRKPLIRGIGSAGRRHY